MFPRINKEGEVHQWYMMNGQTHCKIVFPIINFKIKGRGSTVVPPFGETLLFLSRPKIHLRVVLCQTI